MDRIIQFRGQRVDNSEWVYGGYMTFLERSRGKERLCHYIGTMESYEEVAPGTVGQYTGKKWADNKNIYKGDLLGGGMANPHEVYWDEDESRWGLIEHCSVTEKYYYELEYLTELMKIVGNIHENPDLIT